jgi:putative nucleotidyltransferase with HDIG domain
MLIVQNVGWAIPNYFITAPCGILFAYLYLNYGIYGILLVVIPFLVGRQALNQYAKQRDTYLETVTTLGAYMQHYHPYTRGHLERVANLADKIANQMGLPLQSLMFIHDAGLLHDIGKVGVDEAILDKTGALTDEEWETIKQHPTRGAEILGRMKYLEPMVPWIRGHHERPDGRGYPDGLKDEEISIEALVIAVADAFDAMSGGAEERHRRSYRSPLTFDQAIAQVRYGIGTQFDPRVVKAFIWVMASKEAEQGG